jgi:lipoprotein-releasing system permease protein
MGSEFKVQNRYEQEATFLKIMNGEKWMAFAILCLTLLLVAFNLVGALWMIVLDKRKDISILKTMGATSNLIRNIFLHEGLLVCGIGLIIGAGLALLIYLLQAYFSIIPIREGFIVDSYPIAVKWFDFLAGGLAVMAIGLIASILPSMKADKVGAFIREE